MRAYKVFGPYEVVKDEDYYSVMLPENDGSSSIADDYGCYIYTTKWGDNFTPWYVGKTSRSFTVEILTPHKQAVLDELRDYRPRGGTQIMLIAPERGRGARNEAATDDMETYLIGACRKANPKLLNRRKLGKKDWEILGVTTTERGKRPEGVAVLRGFLGMD